MCLHPSDFHFAAGCGDDATARCFAAATACTSPLFWLAAIRARSLVSARSAFSNVASTFPRPRVVVTVRCLVAASGCEAQQQGQPSLMKSQFERAVV